MREFQEFYELWFKIMSSDPDWDIDVEMNLSADRDGVDDPDILLFESLDDLKRKLEEN